MYEHERILQNIYPETHEVWLAVFTNSLRHGKFSSKLYIMKANGWHQGRWMFINLPFLFIHVHCFAYIMIVVE